MSSSTTFPDVFPKMATRESNGEVSASIHETNRVRALLGLKPLNVGCASSVPSKNRNKSQTEHTSETATSSVNVMEKLYHKLSSKHKSESMIRGISLSEELQSKDLANYSAALWVKKSRHLESTKDKETLNKRMDELYDDEDTDDDAIASADVDTAHLKGKIVNHDMSSFKSGESKILILKDQKILDSAMNINQDEDELINVEMYENELRANKLNEIENTKRNRKYNPLDEDNYNVLLPQYKEKQDITKNKGAFTLNEQGNTNTNDDIIACLNESNDEEKRNTMKAYDLSKNEWKRIASDYKVKFKKKKKKKRKKKRKRITDESEIDGDGVKKRKITHSMDDKYGFLKDSNDGESRRKRDEILTALRRSEIEDEEEKERIKRYNMALYKANRAMEDNLALNDILNKFDDSDGESDDDDIFNKTLERAQILQNKNWNKNRMDIEEEREDRIGKNVEEEAEGIVFSIASQFSDGLNNVIAEMNEDNEVVMKDKDAYEDNAYDVCDAVIVDTEHNKKDIHGGWIECDDDEENQDVDIEKNEENDNDNDTALDSSILDREPLCNRSISDTLSHIRRRGYFADDDMDDTNKHFKPAHIAISKQKKKEIKRWDVERVLLWLKENDKYLYNKYMDNFLKKRIDGNHLINSCGSTPFLRDVIGMNNGHLDISKFLNILGELKGDPAPDIALTHNDQYGEPMTAKEAFRKLSHKFHGKKSGPKKEEKRLKKRNHHLQRRKENNIDTPLQTLKKLKETTKSLHKPFVVLDKH